MVIALISFRLDGGGAGAAFDHIGVLRTAQHTGQSADIALGAGIVDGTVYNLIADLLAVESENTAHFSNSVSGYSDISLLLAIMCIQISRTVLRNLVRGIILPTADSAYGRYVPLVGIPRTIIIKGNVATVGTGFKTQSPATGTGNSTDFKGKVAALCFRTVAAGGGYIDWSKVLTFFHASARSAKDSADAYIATLVFIR